MRTLLSAQPVTTCRYTPFDDDDDAFDQKHKDHRDRRRGFSTSRSASDADGTRRSQSDLATSRSEGAGGPLTLSDDDYSDDSADVHVPPLDLEGVRGNDKKRLDSSNMGESLSPVSTGSATPLGKCNARTGFVWTAARTTCDIELLPTDKMSDRERRAREAIERAKQQLAARKRKSKSSGIADNSPLSRKGSQHTNGNARGRVSPANSKNKKLAAAAAIFGAAASPGPQRRHVQKVGGAKGKAKPHRVVRKATTRPTKAKATGRKKNKKRRPKKKKGRRVGIAVVVHARMHTRRASNQQRCLRC